MKIKDLATIVRNSIDPSSLQGVVAHYSLPAFDDCRSALVQDAAEIESAKTQVEAGDVLISKLNPRIPRVQIVQKVEELKLLASGEFVVLRPHGVHASFLKHFLSSPEITDWLTANCQSVTRSHQRVSPAVIANIELPSSLAYVSLVGRPFRAENVPVVACQRRVSMVRSDRPLAGRWGSRLGPFTVSFAENED